MLVPVRTGAEVAIFVTRNSAAEVLILHRSPEQGGYWHVVAGGVESGESATEAAPRELGGAAGGRAGGWGPGGGGAAAAAGGLPEGTGLVAEVTAGVEVTEYAYSLTEGPAD